MGGRSSSSTKNTTETNSFNNVDYGGGSVGSGSQLLGKNLNLNESTLDVGDINVNQTLTDHGAVLTGGEVAKRAIDSNALVTMDLLDSADSLFDSAFTRAYGDVEDSRELTASIAQEVTDSNQYALQFVGQSLDRSLAAANQFTKGENAQLLEQITKSGMYVALGLGAVFLLTRVKG